MSWTWEQSTGRLLDPTGNLEATGYAGGKCGLFPEGKNNPDMQDVIDVGPLPCGLYKKGRFIPSHPKLGKDVIELIPDPGNFMFGRSGFYMHGDRIGNLGNASDGCPVVAHDARLLFWASPDDTLEVVNGREVLNAVR